MSTPATFVPAKLVLADGRVFSGEAFGAQGTTLGEAVFTTAMTGYQETLTDPSYHRQLIVFTAPQIGNTGWNSEDGESHNDLISAAGIIIRDYSTIASSWRSEKTLEEALVENNIVGIKGVDTRTVVRHLRNEGSIAAGIFSGAEAERDNETLIELVKQQPAMLGANLTADVSTNDAYTVEAEGDHKATVVALDMGIKSTTPARLASRGITTIVVPHDTDFETIKSHKPDGVFVSNGPGDPGAMDDSVATIKQVLEADIPFFGICLGNQLLGRALGMETYKLRFGHRGVNVPVLNHDTDEISITSQNHGFALKNPSSEAGESFDTPFGSAHVTHTCLNDGVVEGVALDSGRAFSVQYHPEAAAGPHDADPLFDQFITLMNEAKK
ncbi:carbamoyl phosphate synthase small subunit [Corynebacterium renale]|uniref:Carbamoyl phosphate synthase small chain n=1 Tax=Corynebacterium renale TaxID=1724 RepID=A0A2A9DPG8_9CORY|nr:glutamine-hydrolyzing carbamoyl-phosphate synthase small subunit [Corynebacterium renale]PFG28647.1 carbamoyl-phosphate synthase small subunit [Corynebacterium renale]SQG64761.1 carbamoyl phosphate synthase small subunit [Corynebacterium renale]SQI26117.1 carbamoyl phosphate synthase small subunit [Corynebacterium renale]STC96182.1 carbamoyl phosphate synthase small subunit [Corynebacterium renale]